MPKPTKAFDFLFPLSHKIVKNLRIVTQHIGDLHVSGTATLHTGASLLATPDERFSVDIDAVKWNGTDIQEVLQITGLMDDINEAALAHASGLVFFSNQSKAA